MSKRTSPPPAAPPALLDPATTLDEKTVAIGRIALALAQSDLNPAELEAVALRIAGTIRNAAHRTAMHVRP
jgi:hypothetical protein